MPTGRPVELTADIIKQVAAVLPRALYVETVSDTIGVHRGTFREWLKAGGREHRNRERGKKPDPKLDLHCELSTTVKRVSAAAEVDYLSVVQAAGSQAWTALAWILERRFPGRWSQNRAELRQLKKQVDALTRGLPGAKPRPQPDEEGDGVDPPLTVESAL